MKKNLKKERFDIPNSIKLVKQKEKELDLREKRLEDLEKQLDKKQQELDQKEKVNDEKSQKLNEAQNQVLEAEDNLKSKIDLINDLIHEQKRINQRMNSSIRIQSDVINANRNKPHLDSEAAKLVYNTSLTIRALTSISNLRMEMFEIGYAPNIFQKFPPEKIYPYKEIEKIYKSINGGYNIEARIFNLEENSYCYVLTKRSLPIAFFILIENAWKYSIPDEPIDITFNESDSQLVISFTNWGPAINVDEIHKLTNRGFRGEIAQLALGNNGKGLGLYIARNILESCNVGFEISYPDCETKKINDLDYKLFRISLIFDRIYFDD